MGRPSIPPGGTGELRYQARQAPSAPWRAVSLDDARRRGWTRARAGRAWRVLQSVGTPDGSRVVSRIAVTHTEAAEATRTAVQQLVGSLSVDPEAPTLGSLLGWVRERIDAGSDPRVSSPRSQAQYLAVLATWCGLGPQDGERTHHYRTSIIQTRSRISRQATCTMNSSPSLTREARRLHGMSGRCGARRLREHSRIGSSLSTPPPGSPCLLLHLVGRRSMETGRSAESTMRSRRSRSASSASSLGRTIGRGPMASLTHCYLRWRQTLASASLSAFVGGMSRPTL